MAKHLVKGQFQSDKYPTTPRGLVPLKVTDPMAQDLLEEYSRRRRGVDPEFSADLDAALGLAGFIPPGATGLVQVAVIRGAPVRVRTPAWPAGFVLEQGAAMIFEHADHDLVIERVDETRPGDTTVRVDDSIATSAAAGAAVQRETEPGDGAGVATTEGGR